MTTFTHQLLSRKTSTPEVWQCECEYSSRSVLRCPSLCCAWAMQKSFSFNQADWESWHHVTRCLAKTSYPTSRWDVAVTNGHCSRTVLPLTLPETQKLVHRIARIWTRLTCHLGCSSADGLPVDKMKRAIVKSVVETTAWRSRCQFITFITFLFTVNVIRQIAPLFSKVDSNKL